MSEKSAGFSDDGAIAEALRGAIVSGEGEFVAALYGAETVEEPKMRELVEMERDGSAELLRRARKKLSAESCELILHERRGTSLAVQLRDSSGFRFEVVVDDIFEQDGRLLTRDLIAFRPLDPVPEEDVGEEEEAT